MALIDTEKQYLADQWKARGAYFGVATASPGSTSTPANEPTYTSGNRVATTWTSGSGGSVTGTAVILNVPGAPTTYTHGFQASGATGNNQIANAALSPSIVLNANGQIVLTPSLAVS